MALALATAALFACAGDDAASSSETTDGATATMLASTDASASSTTAATAPTGTSGSSTGGESASTSGPSGDPGGDPSSESSCENFLPSIEPAILAPGTVDEAYAVAFMVPGRDAADLAWSQGGELPPGLAFDPGGAVLTGTPQSAGEYLFDLLAAPLSSDPECPTAPTGRSYTLVIEP